jgi:hypothetical protein
MRLRQPGYTTAAQEPLSLLAAASRAVSLATNLQAALAAGLLPGASGCLGSPEVRRGILGHLNEVAHVLGEALRLADGDMGDPGDGDDETEVVGLPEVIT